MTTNSGTTATGAGDAGPGSRAVNAMCITPFDENNEIDEAALARTVEHLAASGVGIYLGSYGTGEGHLLRPEEVRRLYEVGVEAAAGRAPVYAAALGFSETEHVIELALEAAAIGVDAVQIHPPRPGPTAIVPRRNELERYYADVFAQVRTPVHLTNQVVMVGYRLPVDLVVGLLDEHPQIVAVNTSDADLRAVVNLIEAVGDRAGVYVGMLSQLVTVLALGGAGALCFEANVAPRLCTDVVDALEAADLGALRRSFRDLMRLHDVLMQYQNPRSVKAAMHHVGLPAGHLRRPYLPLDDDEQAVIAGVLDGLGVGRA